jgi:diguanylate cyclase (GGDEF)-like protein/PAS domain S-box-containing protein
MPGFPTSGSPMCSSPESGPGDRSWTTVLVVEDDRGDATVVMAALMELVGRFRVRWVTSVEAAVATLVHHRFECLVVDLGVPDASGLEVLDSLLSESGDTAIVVVTAGPDDTRGVEAIGHGADDYLVMDEMWRGQLPRCVYNAVERARSRVLLRELSTQSGEAAARSSDVMAAMSDGILVLAADGRVVSMNDAAEMLLGMSAAKLVGQPMTAGSWSTIDRAGNVISDDDRAARVTLATGQPSTGTVNGIRTLDREVVWVEVNTNPLRTSGVQLDGAVVSMRDVGERLAAEEQNRFQAALLAAVGQAVIATDPQGVVIFWNDAAEAMYGRTSAETLGKAWDEIAEPVSVDLIPAISVALMSGRSWTGDFVSRRTDGTLVTVLVTSTPVFDDGGALMAVIGVSTDITERRRAEDTAQAMAAIVASAVDAIYTMTLDEETILTWNGGAERLYGYPADAIIGQCAQLLRSPDGVPAAAIRAKLTAGDTISEFETVHRRRDGSNIEVSATVSPIFGPNATVIALSVISRDISDRLRLEQELIRQALHDGLTGLPNRSLLTDRLSQALADAARRGVPVAVLFCDLDQFKTVNDANGHHIGDEILIQVARRLRAVIRPSDTVARFGGDEFVIICEDADGDEAQRIADRISVTLSDPIVIGGQRLYVSASIGIAVTPPLEADAETLLRCADAAMYDAKAHGRARSRVFDTSLAVQSGERQQLTNELREALTHDSLEVHYQPVVQLATGQLIGIEALTRWRHPTRGWIPPDLFIPLAEEAGLIWCLDKWVLARACRDAATLRSTGALPADARLAVNISARNIADPQLLDVVRQAAANAELPLDALELEVTETGLMTDTPAAGQILQHLRELGLGIALDDFGTGYSSLSNVRQLPVTTVKIDRAFITHITTRPHDLAIATAIIDLAQALGLHTVAEGVETLEQLTLLHQMGCGAGQGYVWSKALPRDELAALITHTPRGFLAATRRHSLHRIS